MCTPSAERSADATVDPRQNRMAASTGTHRTNRRFWYNVRYVIAIAITIAANNVPVIRVLTNTAVGGSIEIPSALGQGQRSVGQVSLNFPSTLSGNCVDSARRSYNFAESKTLSSWVFGGLALETNSIQAFAFHR